VPRSARKTPARIVQGEARRYRFGYTKLGASALLSHLDLIRALPRSFRRVGLPMFYSSGFHPKPEMTFGPALPLGVHSTFEIIDVKLAADLEPGAWLARLDGASGDGLRFFGGVRLGPTDAAISRVIDAARYVILVPASELASRPEGWLDERVAAFLAMPEARVLRRIDGVGKWVDTRSFVRSITRGGIDAAAEARIAGAFAALTVDVEVRGSGGVKIAEVAEAMGLDVQHLDVRTRLGRRVGEDVVSPFDLPAIRAAKASTGKKDEVDAAPEPAAEPEITAG
jgi:radical SAM-linked protein